MLKWGQFLLGSSLLIPTSGWAEVAANQEEKTKSAIYQSAETRSDVKMKSSTYEQQGVDNQAGGKIIDIPTDQELPPSAEKVTPTHPFFAAPNSANELMDKIEGLEKRIKDLERGLHMNEEGNAKIQLSDEVWIDSRGQDIIIHTPGNVKLEAKNVIMPSSNH